jgi:hypothetical protein
VNHLTLSIIAPQKSRREQSILNFLGGILPNIV